MRKLTRTVGGCDGRLRPGDGVRPTATGDVEFVACPRGLGIKSCGELTPRRRLALTLPTRWLMIVCATALASCGGTSPTTSATAMASTAQASAPATAPSSAAPTPATVTVSESVAGPFSLVVPSDCNWIPSHDDIRIAPITLRYEIHVHRYPVDEGGDAVIAHHYADDFLPGVTSLPGPPVTTADATVGVTPARTATVTYGQFGRLKE